jgi:signal transduction histidine kinase/ActR/RegA family two-component response regulator
MNRHGKKEKASSATSSELAQLLAQTENARIVLAQLQRDMVEAKNQLGEADYLLKANEQLVIATLRAHTDIEIANTTLAKIGESVELDAAKRASASKSEFLSRVSHELRTPLNAILGFGHLMLMDDDKCRYLNPEQRERLETIRFAGQQLLALTNDMLDLARIERGHMRIDMEMVDVYAVIRSSEILLRPSALEYNIDVRNLCRKDEFHVMADERALGQVLLNLISNAIKYNRPGGWVSIHIEIRRDEMLIVIKDNGLGMSSAQLADLFQPFNRLGVEQGPIPGCGLGLVISKALVELMGGELSVSSIEGSGTTMEIHLSNLSLPILLPPDSLKVESGVMVTSPITTSCTVLYVEDNSVNAMVMKQLCAAEPAWSLLIAPTGQTGIDMAISRRPSLIILDMQLPDMSGLQVMRALQQKNILPRKGFIALSADAMPTHIAAALAAGFSQYWTKPLDMHQAIKSLREILKLDFH